jgi:hypothetical protein
MRRSRCNEAEAVTFWEETDEDTREASRGKGPGAYGGIAEITSGKTHFQQGLVTTCKDSSNKGNRIRREGMGLAHESVGARKEG